MAALIPVGYSKHNISILKGIIKEVFVFLNVEHC